MKKFLLNSSLALLSSFMLFQVPVLASGLQVADINLDAPSPNIYNNFNKDIDEVFQFLQENAPTTGMGVETFKFQSSNNEVYEITISTLPDGVTKDESGYEELPVNPSTNYTTRITINRLNPNGALGGQIMLTINFATTARNSSGLIGLDYKSASWNYTPPWDFEYNDSQTYQTSGSPGELSFTTQNYIQFKEAVSGMFRRDQINTQHAVFFGILQVNWNYY